MTATTADDLTAISSRSDAGAPARAPSKGALVAGRVFSSVASLFLLADALGKVALSQPALQSTAELGYSTSVVLPLGVVQLICLAAYLLPRTSILGAVLWTGYLGGAIATHVRVANPLFSHILFPVYVATLLWAGLWLREPRLRALLPARAD